MVKSVKWKRTCLALGLGAMLAATYPHSAYAQASSYTVKPGDSLYRIAVTHNMSVNQLMSINRLSSYMIHPGQVLSLVSKPTTTSTTTTTTKPSSTKQTTSYKVYTVVRGDYLYKIANQFGVTINQIKSWNGLSSNVVYVGQKLRVSPITATTPSKTSTTMTSSVKPTTPTSTTSTKPSTTSPVSTTSTDFSASLVSTASSGGQVVITGALSARNGSALTAQQVSAYLRSDSGHTVNASVSALGKGQFKFSFADANLRKYQNYKLVVKVGIYERNLSVGSFATRRHNTVDVFANAGVLTVYAYDPGTSIYYSQTDRRWSGVWFGRSTFGAAGCVPTSMAMVIDAYLPTALGPLTMGQYLYNNTNTFNKSFLGSSGHAIVSLANRYGLKATGLGSVNAIKQSLLAGNTVVAAVGPSRFTTYYHEIVLTGYSNGAVYVRDPGNPGNNGWHNLQYIWDRQSTDSIDRVTGFTFHQISK